MIKVLFDTSAFLAIINNEDGAEIAQKYITNAGMCTVNVAEVVTFLVRNGYDSDIKIKRIINLIRHIDYDSNIAIASGKLVTITKPLGLSLGDRACIATAKSLDIPVYTADKKWSEISKQCGVKIIQIR